MTVRVWVGAAIFTPIIPSFPKICPLVIPSGLSNLMSPSATSVSEEITLTFFPLGAKVWNNKLYYASSTGSKVKDVMTLKILTRATRYTTTKCCAMQAPLGAKSEMS